MKEEGVLASVKRIVDVYTHENGERYFRVNWRDTWERESHLINCEDLLERFWNEKNHDEEQVVIVKDENDDPLDAVVPNSCWCGKVPKRESRRKSISDKNTQFSPKRTHQSLQVNTYLTKRQSRGIQVGPCHSSNLSISVQVNTLESNRDYFPDKCDIGVLNGSISYKNDSISSKNDLVSYKNDSISYKNDSVSYKDDSVSYKDDSVSYKDDSVSYKDDSVSHNLDSNDDKRECSTQTEPFAQSSPQHNLLNNKRNSLTESSILENSNASSTHACAIQNVVTQKDQQSQFETSFTSYYDYDIIQKEESVQCCPDTIQCGVQTWLYNHDQSTQCSENIYQREVACQYNPRMVSCGVQKNMLHIDKYTQYEGGGESDQSFLTDKLDFSNVDHEVNHSFNQSFNHSFVVPYITPKRRIESHVDTVAPRSCEGKLVTFVEQPVDLLENNGDAVDGSTQKMDMNDKKTYKQNMVDSCIENNTGSDKHDTSSEDAHLVVPNTDNELLGSSTVKSNSSGQENVANTVLPMMGSSSASTMAGLTDPMSPPEKDPKESLLNNSYLEKNIEPNFDKELPVNSSIVTSETTSSTVSLSQIVDRKPSQLTNMKMDSVAIDPPLVSQSLIATEPNLNMKQIEPSLQQALLNQLHSTQILQPPESGGTDSLLAMCTVPAIPISSTVPITLSSQIVNSQIALIPTNSSTVMMTNSLGSNMVMPSLVNTMVTNQSDLQQILAGDPSLQSGFLKNLLANSISSSSSDTINDTPQLKTEASQLTSIPICSSAVNLQQILNNNTVSNQSDATSLQQFSTYKAVPHSGNFINSQPLSSITSSDVSAVPSTMAQSFLNVVPSTMIQSYVNVVSSAMVPYMSASPSLLTPSNVNAITNTMTSYMSAVPVQSALTSFQHLLTTDASASPSGTTFTNHLSTTTVDLQQLLVDAAQLPQHLPDQRMITNPTPPPEIAEPTDPIAMMYHYFKSPTITTTASDTLLNDKNIEKTNKKKRPRNHKDCFDSKSRKRNKRKKVADDTTEIHCLPVYELVTPEVLKEDQSSVISGSTNDDFEHDVLKYVEKDEIPSTDAKEINDDFISRYWK